MSTIHPFETDGIREMLKERGISMIDCPIGRTSVEARLGKSLLMVGGEQGDITRSWTSGIQDCGVDSNGNGYYHDRVGIGISGGPGEVYRHNEGYFLIA